MSSEQPTYEEAIDVIKIVAPTMAAPILAHIESLRIELREAMAAEFLDSPAPEGEGYYDSRCNRSRAQAMRRYVDLGGKFEILGDDGDRNVVGRFLDG